MPNNPLLPDPNILHDLLKTPMPYGKYKGTMLADIPVYYLEWHFKKGFPKGKLGMQLSTIYEIKINGLEKLLEGLKK